MSNKGDGFPEKEMVKEPALAGQTKRSAIGAASKAPEMIMPVSAESLPSQRRRPVPVKSSPFSRPEPNSSGEVVVFRVSDHALIVTAESHKAVAVKVQLPLGAV